METPVVQRDGDVPDNFADCPPEARAVLDARLASLDRGEGLTGDELAKRLQARRAARRNAQAR